MPFFSKDKEAYIYIETSSPRMYSEKARLNSIWKTGPQRMEFFYYMYGSTIETLSVYVKINGSEYRVWSRYGSQLSSDWIKGCVTLNYRGTYQVKTSFLSQLFFVDLFVCLFVCLFLCVDAFFCCSSGLLKISSLCYPSWLANAFLNPRKCLAKYSDSISNVIYLSFFFLERKLIAIFLSFKLVDWLETSSFHSNLRNFMKVSGSMAKSGIQ